VLQLSRWFGYRGPHLEFCRIFTTAHIYRSLREIHRNDTDLRYQLAEMMADHKKPEDAALVLRASPRARPTSKMGIGKIHDLAFSPFETVFRDVEGASLAYWNQTMAVEVVERIRARQAVSVMTASGAVRGIMSRGWAALEVADLLDCLKYTAHNPGDRGNPVGGARRPADIDRPVCSSREPVDDPYLVAAYLREWEQGSENGECLAPKFNVAVAFGEIAECTAPFDFPLLNRSISPDMRLESSWTGRSANWAGDAYFDEPNPSLVIPGSALRRLGADGLLLLYIVHKDAIGRQGRGITRTHHTPTFGIVIPSGGPQVRRVTVDQELGS
jgi:hypothetical protein